MAGNFKISRIEINCSRILRNICNESLVFAAACKMFKEFKCVCVYVKCGKEPKEAIETPLTKLLNVGIWRYVFPTDYKL